MRKLTIAGALALALFATPLRADDLADEADLQFQIASDRYDAGDFRGALEHFLASNRLVPNKNVLFNIARCYEQLKQSPDAYRYYLQALAGEKDPTIRKKLEDSIARISPKVARLEVSTNPSGANIYLDRRDLGARGVTPGVLGLPAGKHKIIVELPGWYPAESDPFDLELGKTTKIALELKRIEGTLHVSGEPVGSAVRVDSETAQPSCVVPCTAKLAPGRHVVFFTKDGWKKSETLVEIRANETSEARVKLDAETGSLVVNADLRDAPITIDGRQAGFTPAVLPVAVGQHEIVVAVPGFRSVTRKVDVAVGKETKVDVELSALEEVSAASRYTESIEDAPASVSIVSREELRAMGYPTIAEALRGIRGLYLSDDRSYVTLGVRGFSRPGDYGNRILVTIDGHPANDNYIWSSYIGYDGRVDLEDVERIEIVRGPGSVVYGTSAFFAVINVVTRDKSQKAHAEIGVSHADYGVGRFRVAGVVKLGENAGFWASAAGAHGQGRDMFFSEYASTDPASPSDGIARGVDGFNAGTLHARAWWKALTVSAFLTSRKKQLPTAEYDTIFGDPRTYFQDTRGFVEARFEPKVSSSVQLLSRAHANFYNFDDILAYTDADGGLSHDVFRGTWFGFEQRVVVTPSKSIRFTVGGEVIHHSSTIQRSSQELGGDYIFDDNGNPGRNDPLTSVAGYMLGDVQIFPALKLSAGARFDYFSTLKPNDFGEAFVPPFSPRIALIAKPYKGGNTKIMAGKAFRTPSVYELYYESATQIRPASLQPEQVYSAEIEHTHRFSSSWSGILAGYTNYVTNLIELNDAGMDPTTMMSRQQYANSTTPVMVFGMEAEARRDWKAGWMLALSASVQKAQYLDDPTRRDVPNSPRVLGSVKGAMPIIGRTLMAMTRISIDGPRSDLHFNASDPIAQGKTDVGLVWDLVLSGEIERTGLRWNLGLYNLMDHKWDTIPSSEFRQRTIVQSGRTVLASLQLAL